jgi:hypothetical protein
MKTIYIDGIVKKYGWSRLAYAPRADMPMRVRQFFIDGYDTVEIASIFGYKESSIERWLHVTTDADYRFKDASCA